MSAINSTAPFSTSPFNSLFPGDVILRAADGIHFKVWRLVLTLASPVFRDMFDLPQGDAPPSDPLPIVDVSESSDILRALLLLLYPSKSPSITSYDLAFALIDVYDKYMVDIGGLRPVLAEALIWDKPWIPDEVPLVYALAWSLGFRTAASRASRHMHKLDIRNAKFQTLLIKRSRDALSLVALFDLRERRQEALQTFIEAIPFHTYRCSTHETFTAVHWRKLRERLKEALSVPNPTPRAILEALDTLDVLAGPKPPGASPSSFLDTAAQTSPPSLFNSSPNPVPNGGSLFGQPRTKPSTFSFGTPRSGTQPCAYEGICEGVINGSPIQIIQTRVQAITRALDAFPQCID